MSKHLRHYQAEAKDCVFQEWESVLSTLVVLPTGCGKTVLFAAIIEAIQPQRSLVLAHREELIWQARQKIEKFAKLDCEIEMADIYANTHDFFKKSTVVISTVQTQGSARGDRTRMSRFKPTDFHRIVIDECHHATATSYGNIINYYKQNPEARFLGVTATPDRADEEALGKVFDTVAFDYEILNAIHDGWLVPIEQQFVHINGLDFSDIRTTAGDLNGADLAAVMDSESNLQGVAGATLQIIKDRRTIVFTASVKQAEMLANIFNRHRPNMANWVCGKTNKDTRRSMLDDFRSDKFQVICNCGVLTEGYDDWGVHCIVMARPTKSRSLYAQMAGRATRTVEGLVDPLPTPDERRAAIALSQKPSCLLIDFVGNSGKHKLMSAADILGCNASEEAVARAVRVAKSKGGPANMTELIDKATADIAKEAKQRLDEEEARRSKLVAKVKFTSKAINPFDALDIDPVRERGWDTGKSLSQKQRDLLMRQGIDPDTMHYAAAKAVLNELFRRWKADLCSMKQAAVLKRHGFDAKEIKRNQAKELIDKIAANGWRRPAQLEMPKLGAAHDEESNPFRE
jgi:superfamily II DNA or RNA helicase